MFMSELFEKALDDAYIVAVEAIFELDPFNRKAEKDFDKAIENTKTEQKD